MPPAYTVAHSEERAPFHVAQSSSSNNSVMTLQRAASFSPTKSRSRAPAQPNLSAPEYNGFDFSDARPVTSADVRRPSVEEMEGVNRWSRSTSSSRDRRLSFGTAGTFTFGSPEDKSQSKRLQKSRPSITNSPSRSAESSRPRGPPPNLLPPIISLPALQTSVNNTSSPLTASPSTAGLLSAAAHSAAPDYFSSTWESTTTQKRSPSRSRAANNNMSTSPASDSPNRRQRSSERGEGRKSRGHSRNRSQNGKSSGSSRNSKQPSQKAMLSRALQKANAAVLLDNAQNFDGAMQAYSEACSLLQQVMLRSTGDDDKRKLEAIRNTYTSRISELSKTVPHLRVDDKALPARPGSENYTSDGSPPTNDGEDPAIIETATATRIVNDDSLVPEYQQNRSIPTSQLPKRRESLLPSALEPPHSKFAATDEPFSGRSFPNSAIASHHIPANLSSVPQMESQYMPPPLSPWRPPVPMTHGPPPNPPETRKHAALTSSNLPKATQPLGRARAPSNESMSWLDFIDESDASSTSSVHSRTSSLGVRRKAIRPASGATEAEFDAALDAAVEAAYADGYEPTEAPEPDPYAYDNDDEIVANVRRKVELAKERVRQTEREAAIQGARDREKKRLLRQEQERQMALEEEYNGNESEEEERMLEEMTRGYVMDEFEFGLQSKSALPRESDSSGFSGRTWNSSIGSNPTTTGTALSTVTESTSMAQILTSQSKTPPPSQGLPPPPSRGAELPLSPATPGVRSRRLSGQNAKQLKIETAKLQTAQLAQAPAMPPPRIPTDTSPGPFKASSMPQQLKPGVGPRPPLPQSNRQASSPFPGRSPSEVVNSPTATLTRTSTNNSEANGQELPRSGSPGRAQSRSGLRKNFSSSSLKNLKSRTLSVSNADDGSDFSPSTPLSSQFAGRDGIDKIPAIPSLPTPIATTFNQRALGAPTGGGMYLFNDEINDIISPDSPTAPDPTNPAAPIPLEPCPTEFLLRPFWLMRALYQTIAHPKGGYISTKLFIPRDVWRVKGVKLKNIEDKIANCDFLTAALLKLAQVDTFDADAVLEEMQALESVLEHVQTTLTKKLGNEVGVQGASGMFKDAPAGGDADISSNITKSSSTGKSSSFSWRRLRSKNSGVGLSNSYNKPSSSDGPKEGVGLTMGTLPMTTTALSKVRFAKRDVSQVQLSGPNANYMGALARLFDAAQTLDQIARQVEDPGLRHTDKTQVGLELCTRHAAEFFGFYICRFVLADIGMLLDKFIKRGSEWVLV